MFERFTEKARRVIFFSRYEAGRFGSPYIETEHVLLGLLREDRHLRGFLSLHGAENLRKQLEDSFPPAREHVATTVDIPLTEACKRVLDYAAEEANHGEIDCKDLLRGLLRIDCYASDALKRAGIDYEKALLVYSSGLPQVQKPAGERIEVRGVELPEEAAVASASALQPSVARLEYLVNTCSHHLHEFTAADALHPLKRDSWTRCEALGHLIDWATAHQQWFAVALTEPKLVASTYPSRDLVAAQHYRDCDRSDLIDLWIRLNRLLIHVISKISENKLETLCRIGLDPPIPLSTLIANYTEHCEDLMSQILTRG